MDILSIIQDIGLENFIKNYFTNKVDLFIDFLDKKNLLGEFQQELIDEGYFVDVMKHHYQNDPQYVIDTIVEQYFGDVTYDNNRFWLSMSREDLSHLFEADRWGSGAMGIARKILSSEYDSFFDYVEIYNLEDDVISGLNPDNLNILKEAVYKELEGQEIENDGETDIITLEKVMNMGDKNLSELIKNHAPDVYGNLSSLYNSSYEAAYEEEVYNDVMNELKSLFGTENFSREVPYKRKTLKSGTTDIIEVDDYKFQVDVTNILPTLIIDVLNWGGYNSDNDFEYYGGLEGLLKFWLSEEKGRLSFTISDYPDFRLVEKYINEMFKDYI